MTRRSQARLRAIVIDDDREIRQSLLQLLKAAGWQAMDLPRADMLASERTPFAPDVIVSDVRMPGLSGLDLLDSLQETDAPPVVLISAHGDIPMAVDAMQRGAYSFLEKPFDPRRLLTILQHAAEQFRLRQDTRRLKSRLSALAGLDRILIGQSQSTRDLREEIVDLSDTDANILVLGETGTGKELVARALHDLSARAAAPFIPVNCAAIPLPQAETILFGAVGGPKGLVQSADGGTLFLDEIGAWPLETQAKMLRAIEDREVTPVGSETAVKVDLRIVSATNEDLETAVGEGRLRGDLLFRLNAIVLTLAPLRARREDIPLLFQHFLGLSAETHEIAVPDQTADDMAALLAHDWPGNVREMRHVAERRILAARRGRGSVAEAIARDDAATEVPDTLREAVAAFERQLIGKAISAHQGRMDAVAEALGIGRRTLNEKIVKLGLQKEDFL